MKPYFEEDGITIYHGDCREVLPQLETLDLVLTDPPYGNGDSGRYGRSELGHRTIIGDECLEWLPDAATAMFNATSSDSYCILFGQWRTFSEFTSVFCGAGFELRSCGVWDKGVAGLGAGICEEWEQIMFFRKGLSLVPYTGNVFRHARITGRPTHPNEKPLALLKELVRAFPSDSILDPFMGSGTTLRAAKDLGRRAIGIEIEEKYCEIAAKRLSQKVFSFEVQP